MVVASNAPARKNFFDDFSIAELAQAWRWPEDQVLSLLIAAQEADAMAFSPRIHVFTDPKQRLNAICDDARAFESFAAKYIAGEIL